MADIKVNQQTREITITVDTQEIIATGVDCIIHDVKAAGDDGKKFAIYVAGVKEMWGETGGILNHRLTGAIQRPLMLAAVDALDVRLEDGVKLVLEGHANIASAVVSGPMPAAAAPRPMPSVPQLPEAFENLMGDMLAKQDELQRERGAVKFRDQCAIAAMTALLSRQDGLYNDDKLAEEACDIADAMVAQLYPTAKIEG